jgi:4-azaleucine resistance transporter AzlC
MIIVKSNVPLTIQAAILPGAKAAWPICLGYIPIGLAFGVIAQKAGLSPVEIALMSILVFAGSSQFIAVSMIASSTDILSIVMTTFMVNLRHFLMSSSLSRFSGDKKGGFLSIFSYGITDESFAVNLVKFNQNSWDMNRALVVNQSANLVWIISTVAGGYGSQFIPEKAFGIDYALIAMFICLLVFQLRGFQYVLTSVLAAVAAVILSVIIPGNSYIVMASIIAATLGVLFKYKKKR